MKIFLTIFLITTSLTSSPAFAEVQKAAILSRGDTSGNEKKLQDLFAIEENKSLFVLPRGEMERWRETQLELNGCKGLYKECKETMQPNSFMTPKFLIGSVVVSIGVGALIGFFAFR